VDGLTDWLKSIVFFYFKEAEHGITVSAAGSSATSDAAVGQLIDFDAETPPAAPTNAMANLCTFHDADE